MRIEYYILEENDSNELEAFKAIHSNKTLKDHYKQIKNEDLETSLFVLNESILAFVQNEVILNKLKDEDLECLPIVLIDEQIKKSGKLLTVEELSNVLDVGITIQTHK